MGRFRTRYPAHVREALEKAYNENPDVRSAQFEEIAHTTGLTIKQVRAWFYCKRYMKKISDEAVKQIIEKEEAIEKDTIPKKAKTHSAKKIKKNIFDTTPKREKTHSAKKIKKDVFGCRILEKKESKEKFILPRIREQKEKMKTITKPKAQKIAPVEKMKTIAIPPGIRSCLILCLPTEHI